MSPYPPPPSEPPPLPPPPSGPPPPPNSYQPQFEGSTNPSQATGESWSFSANWACGKAGLHKNQISRVKQLLKTRPMTVQAAIDEVKNQQLNPELRDRAFDEMSSTCPFPLEKENKRITGSLSLLPDEFLILVGREWGFSSQKLTLTTHRLIYSQGRIGKDQKIVYLTDIRDVVYSKSLGRHGKISIDTASGRIEGLDAISSGNDFRNQLLSLVHWARQRSEQSRTVVYQQPIAPVAEDIPGKLKQLIELRDAQIISPEEFEVKRTELIARL